MTVTAVDFLSIPTLVDLIAQAVFLLQCGHREPQTDTHTHTHTNLQTHNIDKQLYSTSEIIFIVYKL